MQTFTLLLRHTVNISVWPDLRTVSGLRRSQLTPHSLWPLPNSVPLLSSARSELLARFSHSQLHIVGHQERGGEKQILPVSAIIQKPA